MTSRIGVLVPYAVGATAELTTKQMVVQTTENIGNLMFRYAATQLFPDHVTILLDKARIAEYREAVDVVVYPTANQMNPSVKNLDYHADFFEKLGKPVVMIGLGAQSEEGEDISKLLAPSAVKFFKVISELSSYIGVRGSFTAEMLEKIGVRNTKVFGCPSNFINQNPALGESLQKRYDAIVKNPKTIVRASLFPQHGRSYTNAKHRASELKLFDWCMKLRGGSYIVNGPFPAMTVARRRTGETSVEERKYIAEFFMPEADITTFEARFRSIARVFPQVEGLMEHLSQDDFVLGKRIHGAFAATQSGTPALVIAHDSRTRELATTTGTPFIPLADFEKAADWADVLANLAFSGAAYDETRKRNYREFVSLFNMIPYELTSHLYKNPLML